MQEQITNPTAINEINPFEPVFLVAVRHINRGLTSQLYWFMADEKTSEQIQYNDWVLVQTRYGPATGKVMFDPIMVVRNQDLTTLRIALEICGEMKWVVQKIEWIDPV